MKQKDELKDEIVDFIKNICEEFPNIGNRMKGVIGDIEADLDGNFSVMTMLKIRTDIAEVMSHEVAVQEMTTKELSFLLDAIKEHIKNKKESGNRSDLMQVERLKKTLKLEIRNSKVSKKMTNIAKEVMKIIGKDKSILDPDSAVGIYSGFIQLAEGRKPEDIPEFKENLHRCETIIKMYRLKDRATKLEEEKESIVKELIASDVLRDKKRMLLEKEIISSKIRLIERGARNYKDIENKKRSEILLRKIKNFMLLVDKERKWNDLSSDLSEYFKSKQGLAKEPFGMKSLNRNNVNIIPGIFNAG